MKRKNALRVGAVTLALGILMSMPVSAGKSHQWKEIDYDISKYQCTQCSNVHNVKYRQHQCKNCGITASSQKASSKHLGIPDIDYRKYCGSCSG